jgi:hypothetical protein
MIKHTIEIVGWVAAALMLSAYVLLTMNRLNFQSKAWS